MTENKWIQQIKSIYQDTSTLRDLQIKRVIEAIFEAGREEGIGEEPMTEPSWNITEEREEAEA